MIDLFRSLFAPPRHLILLLLALWLGLFLAERRAARHGIPKEAVSDIVYYAMAAYVIGGRLLYALANLAAFTHSPLSLFSLNTDLFDPWGGLAAAVLAGTIHGRRRGLPLWPALDALTPVFAVLAVGLSLSHLAAGTAYGSPAALPWSIQLWGAQRHPAQLYELGAALIVLFVVISGRVLSPAGSTFLLFTALAAGARLFLEAFRGDSTLVFGGLRLAQMLAWLALAAALAALEARRRPA